MPLKAVLNGTEIFSFQYSPIEWQELTQACRNNHLIMQCCGAVAIPSRSNDGIPYFRHTPLPTDDDGEGPDFDDLCHFSFEFEEDKYLKYVFAKAGINAGWEVRTEETEMTPNGFHEPIDVFCRRGLTLFGIGTSGIGYSTKDIEARFRRLSRLNIHFTLLYEISDPSELFPRLYPSNLAMPTFAFCRRADGQIYLPELNIEVELFAKALMNGQVNPRTEAHGYRGGDFPAWYIDKGTWNQLN